MHHSERATTQPWICRVLLPLALAVAATACTSQASDADNAPAVEKYLGIWNYNQPDRTTLTNIAVTDAPGRNQVPQVGDIVFTADGTDRIIGRTDVGCTWRFKASAESLELDPPSQLCHNPTQHVAYTVSRWTVTVDGDQEKETIAAKSHRADRDYDFAVQNGARTKAEEYDPDATDKFTGTWAYDPADPATGANLRATTRTAPDGARMMDQSQEQGNVRITRDYGNRVTARTDNGCSWSLSAHGNTAKLDPPVQTCTLPTAAAITLRSWTIATDGEHQASTMIGTDERGSEFVVGVGSVSRR
ncbi:hypothetical protein [Nocardia mexicana]|uniref:Lipocalin-like protein n=1 Tax=Nocardia mexicana TaxID=279262 RepID=A0A370GJV6_9NOCA|nr:hypothetical protein [Nocardia mexicana]RDI43539.1 hypothetical protein DFR68_1206 [Nocardia mexicana]